MRKTREVQGLRLRDLGAGTSAVGPVDSLSWVQNYLQERKRFLEAETGQLVGIFSRVYLCFRQCWWWLGSKTECQWG